MGSDIDNARMTGFVRTAFSDLIIYQYHQR